MNLKYIDIYAVRDILECNTCHEKWRAEVRHDRTRYSIDMNPSFLSESTYLSDIGSGITTTCPHCDQMTVNHQIGIEIGYNDTPHWMIGKMLDRPQCQEEKE